MRAPGVVNLGIMRGRDPNTYYAKSIAGSADVALRSDEAMAGTIALTGALTGSVVVTLPLGSHDAGGAWTFLNLTTGQHTVTVKPAGGSGGGVVLDRGARQTLVFSGTDFLQPQETSLFDAVRLVWVAGQRGKPGINANIQDAAEAVRMITDPDFEILGVNASSDDVTFNAEGGIKVETDGADGDEVILLPHLDANQSAWTQWTWGTDQQTAWECKIKTGASIGNCILWAGLKLTNTEVTATDNDQAFFRYENGVNSGKWQAIDSNTGTDNAQDSGVTVAANTEYRLRVAIDEARIPRYTINGTLVATGNALKDATDLIPYIGVAADGAAEAKSLIIYGQAIQRKAA